MENGEIACMRFKRWWTPPNYFNCEINPNGVLNMEYGPAKTDRISIVRSDAKEYFGTLHFE